MTQNTIKAQKLVIQDTPKRQIEPITEAMAIHGDRRPQCERVRSERAPAIGVVRVEKTEVTANSRARLLALFAGSRAAI